MHYTFRKIIFWQILIFIVFLAFGVTANIIYGAEIWNLPRNTRLMFAFGELIFTIVIILILDLFHTRYSNWRVKIKQAPRSLFWTSSVIWPYFFAQIKFLIYLQKNKYNTIPFGNGISGYFIIPLITSVSAYLLSSFFLHLWGTTKPADATFKQILNLRKYPKRIFVFPPLLIAISENILIIIVILSSMGKTTPSVDAGLGYAWILFFYFVYVVCPAILSFIPITFIYRRLIQRNSVKQNHEVTQD